MNKTKLTLSILATFLFIIFCAAPSQAIAPRTYVAGPNIGNDANAGADCPFSAPCRFFQTAFNQTSAGGEIVALTSGVGYGGLTINKAITITGPAGQGGFITVTAGVTGFTVSAGASDQVLIRNLAFNGAGAAGSTGLSHFSGKLIIENCNFSQLTTGVLVTNAKADLFHTNLSSNTTGLRTQGVGCDQDLNACGGPTQVRVAFGSVNNNGTAFHMANPGFGACPGGFMCPPTVPKNNVTIYVFQVGQTGLTNLTGNSIMVSGSGTGCAAMGSCQNLLTYSFSSPTVNP